MKKILSMFFVLAAMSAVSCDSDDTDNEVPPPSVTTVKPVLTKTFDAEIPAEGLSVGQAATLALVDGNGKALDFETYRSKVTLTSTGDAEVRILEEGVTWPDEASVPGTKGAQMIDNAAIIAITFPANDS